jgi:hypothetical protein
MPRSFSLVRLAAPAMAAALAGFAQPAAAQFLGPWGGVWGPPPPRIVDGPIFDETRISPRAVSRIIRAQGYRLISAPRYGDERVVAIGENGAGVRARFVIDAFDGELLRMSALNAPAPAYRGPAAPGMAVAPEFGAEPAPGYPAAPLAKPKPKPKTASRTPPAPKPVAAPPAPAPSQAITAPAAPVPAPAAPQQATPSPAPVEANTAPATLAPAPQTPLAPDAKPVEPPKSGDIGPRVEPVSPQARAPEPNAPPPAVEAPKPADPSPAPAAPTSTPSNEPNGAP